MHATGEYAIAELMEVFSVGRATVYRVLERAAHTTTATNGTDHHDPPSRSETTLPAT